jgi:hypothetical protein
MAIVDRRFQNLVEPEINNAGVHLYTCTIKDSSNVYLKSFIYLNYVIAFR